MIEKERIIDMWTIIIIILVVLYIITAHDNDHIDHDWGDFNGK